MFKNSKYVYGEGKIDVPAKLNFGEYILEKFWETKDKVCWIDAATDKSITYSQILQESMNLAVCLTRIGVRKGETVAICSENRFEFWGAVIGSVCAGAVVTTINVGYTKDELKHVMNITKPKYIFCSPFSYKNYEKALKSMDFLRKIFLFGDETHFSTSPYKDMVVPNENGLKENVKYEEFQVVDVKGQNDTLFVLYSSGTTGLPKGVMLTHLNVLAACCLPPGTDKQKLSLTISPWFHVMGLVGSLVSMAMGRTTMFLAKFHMDTYLRAVEKYKVSQLGVVPPILVALSKMDIKYDLSTVELIYSGAAPLSKDLLELLNTKFPKVKFLQGYGLTEVTLAATRDRYDISHLAKQGGVGYVVGGTVIKIVDPETRQVLGPNQPGEICVKGVLVFKGYIGKDMKNDFDEEGFFRTGDIGYYDDDKYFFIVDRLKELIKYKAYQVPPAEIEALLLQHKGIMDAGVVGIPHRTAGEVPLAFVVRQPDSQVTEQDVKDFVASKLSNPKHLRGGVRFVDQIPKNPSGKILRKTLRSMTKKQISRL